MPVPIVMYHALAAERSPISVSPAAFAAQMRWLHERAYTVLPLGDLIGRVRRGGPLPARAIVLTFDDGFASVYTHVFPVLARHGFPATVFLVPGYCGGRNDWPGQPAGIPRWPLLTWEQVREMDRHGIEFGAHTMTHARLDLLAPTRLEHEIVTSKQVMEDRLGHAVEVFSYPYGRHSPTAIAAVGRSYSGACGTRPGRVDSSSDVQLLPRVDAQYCLPLPLFRSLSSAPFGAYLALRGTARRLASTVLERAWV